jgi:acyl-CoA synthetase (AMP-forming)/AMP-acid ligase II
MLVNKTIFEYLVQNSKTFGLKPALLYDDIVINWSQMLQVTTNLANNLTNTAIKHKLSADFKVLVRGDCGPAHVVAIVSLMLSRISYVPQNRTLERSDASEEFSNSPKLEINESEIRMYFGNDLILSVTLEDLLKSSSKRVDIELSNKDYPAAFYFTSGTTGNPKIIVSSLNNLIRGGNFVIEALELESTDVIAGTLQLDFDYGVNQIMCNLILGATFVCCPFSSFKLNWINETVQKRVTVVPAMPFLIERFFVRRKGTNQEHNVRLVTSSGAPFSEKHFARVLDLFPGAACAPMYGLSEGFRATILNPMQYSRRPNSVGLPIGDTEVAIVDSQDKFLEANEIGEILQSHGCTTWGYYKNPVESAKRFVSFQDFPNRIWVRSGDLGYLDSEGFLYVTGRIESQIKRFGIRISIDEVENAVKGITGVKEAVVIPMTTNETESTIYLAVSVHDLSEEQLISELRKLPTEYMPQQIKLLDELPGNYNGGKPDRTAIRVLFNGN